MSETNISLTKTEKIDNVLKKIAKIFSYIGVIAVVIMAILAVGDILAAKIFHGAIPNQRQWIQYGLIPVVFTFLPAIVMNRGLMSVDILTRKFPKGLLIGIECAAYLVGTVLFGFLTWRGFALLKDHIASKTMSANQLGAFYIWPFTLIFAVSLAFVCIACLWRTYRTIAMRNKTKEEKK